MELNKEQQQKLKKLNRLAKAIDGKEIAVMGELNLVEESLEAKIKDIDERVPQIDEAIAKLKDGKDGKRGKTGKTGKRGPKGEKGDKGKPGKDGKDGKQGEKGDRGPRGERGKQGKPGKDGHIKDLSPQEVRDSLELLQGEERLDKSAIKGFDDAVKDSGTKWWGGVGAIKGLQAGTNVTIDDSNQQYPIISAASGGADSPTFEKVNKNLSTYPYTFNYTGDNITSIVYTTDGGTITKTLNYTGSQLTSVVLSGDLPVGLSETTKTLSYTGDTLSSISYS